MRSCLFVALPLLLAGCSSSSTPGGTGDMTDSGTTPSGDDGGTTPPAADGATAPPAGDSGATADEDAWLTPMNAARAAVGEAPLTWDPIAAKVAQSYGNMCNFEHNPNASAEYTALGGSGGLGENLSAGAPTQDPGAAVASWVAEESNYDHATNTCAAGQVCGHYTQVVWSNTTQVGCAHVSCTANSPFGSGGWDFLVCDFNPPGNYEGQAPY